MTRIVAVAGSRNYRDYGYLASVLDTLHSQGPIDLLVTGGAMGADCLAEHWAHLTGIMWASFTATWKQGPSGGPRRTTLMLELCKPSVLVAFPGGKGTEHAVKEAHRLGIEVIDVP